MWPAASGSRSLPGALGKPSERLGIADCDVRQDLAVELDLGEANSNYRRAKEALMKAESYAYRDRRNKKRDFRRLWIARINAAARREGMTYSQFMHGLRLAEVELDRKILADIAVRDPETFRRFAERAREAAAA